MSEQSESDSAALQCKVVSEGIAIWLEVVRTLEAPCFNSSLICDRQKGRNLSVVLVGCANARLEISCPIAFTAFDFALVVT